MAASIIDNLKRQFGQGSVLLKLIYINVAVFLLLRIAGVVLLLFNIDLSIVLPYIEMPSDPYEFITHPWTLLTYMFVHYDVWHILFNMLWLYWFGQIFLTAFGEKQMVGLYLWGGIAGGLLYLLSYNLFPYFEGKQGLMCGASASIIAIVVATAFRMPDYKINLLFLGAISLKYIAIVTILIDLLSVTSANGGGHIAHLGGALLGYWFIVRWEKGKDLTAPLNLLFVFARLFFLDFHGTFRPAVFELYFRSHRPSFAEVIAQHDDHVRQVEAVVSPVVLVERGI